MPVKRLPPQKSMDTWELLERLQKLGFYMIAPEPSPIAVLDDREVSVTAKQLLVIKQAPGPKVYAAKRIYTEATRKGGEPKALRPGVLVCLIPPDVGLRVYRGELPPESLAARYSDT